MANPRALEDTEFLAFVGTLSTGESLFTAETIDRLCALAGLTAEDTAAVYAGAERAVDVWRPSAQQLADLLALAG